AQTTPAATAVSGSAPSAQASGMTGSAVVHVRALSELHVTPVTASVPTGGTQAFAAYGRLNGGDSVVVNVVWGATGGSISSDGLYSAGPTPGGYVVAATGSGFSAEATVVVTSSTVASVSVSPASATLSLGATQQLAASLKDASGSPLSGHIVTWATSNGPVATVDATGLVTAVAPGTATITATSEGQSGTSTVTVSNVPVASVTLSPASTSVVAGQRVQLTATPKDSVGNALTSRAVTWTSSNAGVATVSTSGLVTGVAAGTTTITTTSEGKTATATVTVTNVPVAAVA